MDETSITKLTEWIEKRAKEVLCVAKERGITHADAVELVVKHLHPNHKLKIIEKATDLFIKEKVAEASKLQKRRMS